MIPNLLQSVPFFHTPSDLQAMTSLAGGAKAKKADEPTKKVVLKKEDVTVIVSPLTIFSFDDFR